MKIKNIYSLEEVEDIQRADSVSCCDIVGGTEDDFFERRVIPIETVEDQVPAYADVPNESRGIVDELVETVEKYHIDLSPIVVDENYGLMDGWHRVIAYTLLGFDDIDAFVRIDLTGDVNENI